MTEEKCIATDAAKIAEAVWDNPVAGGYLKSYLGKTFGDIAIERLCNEDCNHCPIINHPNSRLLTKILNELHDTFGNGVYLIVQKYCPNLTVCKDCRIDDFCHLEGCDLTQYT